MTNFAILLDSQNAKVFSFADGEVTHHAYHRREPEHHTSHAQEHDKDSEHFFHQVASHLTGATHLLLLGHGLGKDHFKSHLERHHHQDLASKILAVETVDHPTDAQVVAQARALFLKHHIHV